MKLQQQGHRIVWLVRGLAAMGLAGLFVTLGGIGWTLIDIRGDISAATGQQQQLNETTTHLRELALAARTQMRADLDDTMSLPAEPVAVTDLIQFVHSQLNSLVSSSARNLSADLSRRVKLLAGLSARIRAWHQSYYVVWADLRHQVTLTQVRTLVSSLRDRVEAVAEQRRSDDAAALQRWHAASGEQAAQIAGQFLQRQDQRQGDLDDVFDQITQLQRLVERLSGEEQSDALSDLQNHQIIPVLRRLDHDASVISNDSALAGFLTPRIVQTLQQAIFGPSGDGGLFGLRRDALQLRSQREMLKSELAEMFGLIEMEDAAIAQSTQARAMALTGDMEESLIATWQRILIFGGCCSLVFVWLSQLISTGIKGQVRLIEHARASAEDDRRTTQQLLAQQQTAATELDRVNKQLIQTSRQAGMAEVATGVLHNVGNVLNSVNVSANVIADKINRLPVANLAKVSAMMETHSGDLADFLTADEKGRRLPEYIAKVAALLGEENAAMLSEMSHLSHGIEHIKQVVQLQQDYARSSTFRQPVNPATLIEDALRINLLSLERHGVEIMRQLDDIGEVTIDKHKVLQILINLISNAKNAVKQADGSQPRAIGVRLCRLPQPEGEPDGDIVRFQIIDNGVGIAAENLSRIFNHGFTTSVSGHGFGLHTAANAAREMGGSLTAHSDGLGKGATFTLDVPLEAPVSQGVCP